MKPALFSEEAHADALEAFEFYERRRRGLGPRFRDHLDHAIVRICEDSGRYPVVYRGLRRRLIERFPYAVYYRVYPTLVFVVAVMHGRRHSDHLKRRAPGDEE